MSCTHCQKSEIRDGYPFRRTETLVDACHYSLDVGLCVKCGQLALMYWVEIYDNDHDYACTISQDELDLIRTTETKLGKKQVAMNILRSRDVVVSGTQDRGFGWWPGVHAILDGPAW